MSIDVDTLDTFTKQYLGTALWSSTNPDAYPDDTPLDKDYGIHDFEEATLERMVADCKKFQDENADDIADDPSRAGHDFWLTRNGHGCGFWDGDWPEEAGERLTKAAEAYGEQTLFVNDSGQVELM